MSATLTAGFTTVRNVGANGYSDTALRDAINAGDVPGPRMLASGPPLSITGGHADNNYLAPQYNWSDDGVADGVDGVTLKVREDIKYGSDVIKFCATGGVLSKGDSPDLEQFSPEEMRALIAEAHRLDDARVVGVVPEARGRPDHPPDRCGQCGGAIRARAGRRTDPGADL